MEKKSVSIMKKIVLAALVLLMTIGVCLGAGFMQNGQKEDTITAKAAGLDIANTPIAFTNNTGMAVNAFTFQSRSITGTKENLEYSTSKKDPLTGDYYGKNKTIPFVELYFKGDPTPIKNDATMKTMKLDHSGHTSSLVGPYRIQAVAYTMHAPDGNYYMPFGMISSGIPKIIDGGLMKVTPGQKINATELATRLNGVYAGAVNIYLPIEDNWVNYDENGRAYFTIVSRKFYITNFGAGITENENDSGIVTQNKNVSEDEEAQVTAYLQSDREPTSVGTYDGKGNKCPVGVNSVYLDVSDIQNTTTGQVGDNGDAGTYTATVKPKDGFTWADGKTDPKTITWKIDKAENDVSLSSPSVTFGKDEKEKRIPLTVGELYSLSGAACTVTKDGEAYSSVTATIDETDKMLVLKRTTQDAAEEISVSVTFGESTNYKTKTLTATVTLEAGAGFYIEGTPGKIYETLEAAIAAANGSAIVVNGEVTVDTSSALTLPGSLTLKGSAGSKLTVTGNGTLFDVGSGKNLTLEDLSVEGSGAALVNVGAGGSLTMTDVRASGFNGAVKASGEGTKVTFGGANIFSGCTDAIEIGTGAVMSGSEDGSGKLSVKDCTGTKGALSVTGGTVNAENLALTFEGCISEGNGAAVSVTDGSFSAGTLSVVTCTTENGKGGAIYVGGGTVSLGAETKITNNTAKTGNGVYIADGATLTMDTAAAAGITDGIMLGHDAAKPDAIAGIELEGTAPVDGGTIVVEFESPQEQLDVGDTHNEYITSGELNSDELKSFMRVKNAGYTFDPLDSGTETQKTGALGLTTSSSYVAVVEIGDGSYKYCQSVQEAVDYIRESQDGKGTVYLTTYTNTDNPALNTTEVVLDETVTVYAGMEVTFASGKVEADNNAGTKFTKTEDVSVTLKRSGTLMEEMIRVGVGASLTLGKVTLDGGAKWEKPSPTNPEYQGKPWAIQQGNVRIIDDGNGGAGSVETNNIGAEAHAPVIVNDGTLVLGSGSTIQNNDNNWATPGFGFGSENYGGGVRNEGKGSLTMEAGSQILDCYSREGGAIMNVNKPQETDGKYAYRTDGTPTVEIKGGTISGNVSQMKGAAVQSIYGGAETTVSDGASITGNVSLNDLGVLSVEEGASLTVSGGTITAADGDNALYLYNKYSAADYSDAATKPFIEGTADFASEDQKKGADNAAKLTVTGGTITGNVHVDGSCYVVDPDSADASEVYYDPYLDVTGYRGAGDLSLTFDDADGKIAKGSAADLQKLGYPENAVAEGQFSDAFTFTYTDATGTYLAQGSYELHVSQSEPNKLHVEGKVDASCGSVTVTVNGKEYPLDVTKGDVEGDIDLTKLTETPENGDLSSAFSFGYGTDGNNKVEVKNGPTLSAVLHDEENDQYIFPTGAQYKTERGNFESVPADGSLPEDLGFDAEGNVTFKWGETEVSLAIGTRGEAPTINGSATNLKDVTDNSLLLELTDKDAYSQYEYQLRTEDGTATAWVSPKDGVLTFEDLAEGTRYTLYARTPAADGNLPGVSLGCMEDVYSTLTAEQMTRRDAFVSEFNEKFNADEGTYSPKDGMTGEDIKNVLDSYDAFAKASGGYTAPSEDVLALFDGYQAAAQSAYDQKSAEEWLKKYEQTLKTAAEYVAGDDSLFGDVQIPSDSADLKATLKAADEIYQALTNGAKSVLSQLLSDEKYASPLATPLSSYLGVARKDMAGKIQELEGTGLEAFGSSFLTALGSAESVEEAEAIEGRFDSAKTAADAIRTAYETAAGGLEEGSRSKQLLDEKRDELYLALADISDGNYSSVTDGTEAALQLAVKKGKAQDALIGAFDAIAWTTFGAINPDDLVTVTPEGIEYKDKDLFELYNAAQAGLGTLTATADGNALKDALKEAVKALLVGTTSDDGADLTGSVMREGDSKAVKDYLEGVKTAVDGAEDDTNGLPDVLKAVSETGSEKKTVAETLQGMRAGEAKQTADDYRAIYKLLTGNDAPAETAQGIEDAKDAKEANDAWKAALGALLGELGEGEGWTAHIEVLQDLIDTAYDTAEIAGSRTVAQALEAIKGAENDRLTASKDAAKAAFEDYYQALTGENSVPAETKQALKEALGGITLDEKDVPAALAEVNEVLKNAVNELLDGLVDTTKDSTTVQDIVTAAKEAVTDAAADDYTGISDLTEALEDKDHKGVKEQVEAARAADIQKAKDAYVDAYNALTGETVGADSDKVKSALDAIGGAQNAKEANEKLAERINALIESLKRTGDPKEVTEYLDGIKTAVGEAQDAADEAHSVLDPSSALGDVKNTLDSMREAERTAAKNEYLDAYKALTGNNSPDESSDPVKSVLEAIGAAQDAAEANSALKEGVKELLDGLVRTDAEGKQLDSAAVKSVADAQKGNIDGVQGDENTGISDLNDAVAAAKKAIEDARAADIQKEKDAYVDAYNELTGETVGADSDKVKSALDAIGGAQNAKEANEKLAERINDLIDSLKSAGDSKAVTDYLDGIKTAVNAAKDAADGTNSVLDPSSALGNVKSALDGKREEERTAAKEAYREFYKAVTGETTVPEDKSPAKEALGRLDGCADNKALNDALKDEVNKLLDSLLGEGDSEDAKGVVDAAKAAAGELFDNATAAKGAADTDAVKDAVKDVRGGVEDSRTASKEAAKEAFQDVYEAVTGETLPTNPDGSLDMEKLPAEVREVLDAIENGETAADADKAAKDAATKLVEDYLKDGDPDEAKNAAEDAGKKIQEAQPSANGVSDLTDIVETYKNTVDGERYLADNEVLKKDFGNLNGSDKSKLEEAKEDFAALPDGAKGYLDDLAVQEGYTGFEKELEDKHNKAAFEETKEGYLEETAKSMSECEGNCEYLKDRYDEQVENIQKVEYEQHTDDTDREAYNTAKKDELTRAYEDATDALDLAKDVQQKVAQTQERLKELQDSGNYKSTLKDLGDIAEKFEKDAKGIGIQGKDGMTAQEVLEGLYEDALTAFNDTPVYAVTTGDIKADGSPKTEGGTGDYKEGDNAVWGIVTNDANMPGGIRLVIEKTEDRSMDSIDAAKDGGKLKAAIGANLTEEQLAEKVSDKKVVSTLDIYLLKNNAKIVEFEGTYVVMVLLPNELRGLNGLTVVYEKDGEVEVFDATVSGDGKYLTFKTDHFSEFVILAEDTLNLWWLIITLSVILAVELAGIAVTLVKRKKNKKEGKGGEKTASVLPLALLAVLLPAGALVACVVLGACVVGAGTALVVIAKKGKKKPGEKEEPAPQKEEKEEESKKTPAPAPQKEEPKKAPVAVPVVLPVPEEEEEETAEVWDEEKHAFVTVRYDRSFTARLSQAEETDKEYYRVLKAELLSYGAKSRISWKHETFRVGRELAVKMRIRGKTLCVYFALDPKQYLESKYKIEDVSDVNSLADVPTLYRIINDRRCRYAKELIAAVMAKYGLTQGELPAVPAPAYETTETLLKMDLIRIVGVPRTKAPAAAPAEEPAPVHVERRESVRAAEVDSILGDEVAATLVEESARYADRTKTGIVNIDTLEKYFENGETVTLDEIKNRIQGYKKVTYLKVLARGVLDKALTVEADDFSIEAVKMILLTGGKVLRTRTREN